MMLRTLITTTLFTLTHMAQATPVKGYCAIGIEGARLDMQLQTDPNQSLFDHHLVKLDDQHSVRVWFTPGFGMSFVHMGLLKGEEVVMQAVHRAHGEIRAQSKRRGTFGGTPFEQRDMEEHDALQLNFTLNGESVECEYLPFSRWD